MLRVRSSCFQYLFGVNNIHYDATFKHLCKASLDGEIGGSLLAITICAMTIGGDVVGHTGYRGRLSKAASVNESKESQAGVYSKG